MAVSGNVGPFGYHIELTDEELADLKAKGVDLVAETIKALKDECAMCGVECNGN